MSAMSEKPKAATFRKVLAELEKQVARDPTLPRFVCNIISLLRYQGRISAAQAEVCEKYTQDMVRDGRCMMSTLEIWIDHHYPHLRVWSADSHAIYRRSNATRIAWVKHIIQVLEEYEHEQQQ